MPFYEYRCERGHTFEVMQRMSDEPLATCTTCHAAVQRVFHPVAVHFKGSGFYNTDYGKSRSTSSEDSGHDGSHTQGSESGSQGSQSQSEGSQPQKDQSAGDSAKTTGSQSAGHN